MNIPIEKIKEWYLASVKLKKHPLAKLLDFRVDSSNGDLALTCCMNPKYIKNAEDLRAICEYTSSQINSKINLLIDTEHTIPNIPSIPSPGDEICVSPGDKTINTKTYLWNHDLLRKLYQLVSRNYSGGVYQRYHLLLTKIHLPPYEYMAGDKTCRLIRGTGYSISREMGGEDLSYCVSQTDKTYNYLDQGKYLYFINNDETTDIYKPDAFKCNRTYVFDQIDANTFILLYLLKFDKAPVITDKVLIKTNGVYIRADMQASLIASLEQQLALSDDRLVDYREYKEECFRLMRVNSQNIVHRKFHDGEIGAMRFNDMSVTRTKISYENISFEADDLYATVISKLGNVSEGIDIYSTLAAYTRQKIIELNSYAMNPTCTGFMENKSMMMGINDIPIEITVCTENTRRKINGFLIKADEISKCLNRATCYHNVENYNLFLRDVAYLSLEVRDAFANGLPIKLWVHDTSPYSEELRASATGLHPKLWFVNEGRHYVYLYTNADKSNKVRIKKFTSFISAVKILDRKINGRRGKNCEWGKRELLLLVNRFAEIPLDTITQNLFIDSCLAERAAAQRRSEELLAEIVKSTGAVECTYRNSPAFKVTGTLREYYVLKDTNQVYAADTGKYICIVTNKGEMGVGYDDLTSRILHLKNDERVMNKITTLRK